jgi:hypothetical protein
MKADKKTVMTSSDTGVKTKGNSKAPLKEFYFNTGKRFVKVEAENYKKALEIINKKTNKK